MLQVFDFTEEIRRCYDFIDYLDYLLKVSKFYTQELDIKRSKYQARRSIYIMKQLSIRSWKG